MINTCCGEHSEDPDQLASEEASLSRSTLFSIECICGFILFKKRVYTCILCYGPALSPIYLHKVDFA